MPRVTLSNLGTVIRKSRLDQGLTLHALADRLRCGKLGTVARRIERLEREGRGDAAFVECVAVALGIDVGAAKELAAEDERELRAEVAKWPDKILTERESLRVLFAVPVPCPIPDGITEQQVIDYWIERNLESGGVYVMFARNS
jgi:transcriptional regulator with XRE-family HTH domain